MFCWVVMVVMMVTMVMEYEMLFTICNISSQYCPLANELFILLLAIPADHHEKCRRSVVTDKKELQWDPVHIWRTWHGEEWAGIFLRRSLTWNISTTYILHPVRPSAKYECNFIWNMTQTTERGAHRGYCVSYSFVQVETCDNSASCVLSQVWTGSYLNVLTQKKAGF